MNTPQSAECAELLERVGALAPVVSEYRAALERERRLPQPVFDAIADAGLLRLWLPKTFGGPELSALDFMLVVEAAAALEGSVGWLVGNGGGMSRTAGYVAAEVAAAWFTDPRAFIVAATGAVGDAVPVPGGFRISGRWPFGSGIHHATIAMGLCRIADGRPADAAHDVIACHVAAADAEIIDNWHVSGLRGTGSCDFVIRDVFVPSAHCYSFPETIPTQRGPVYRLPAISVFGWTVSVVPLGIARGALDSFAALAARKGRSGSQLCLRDQEVVQSEFGRLDTRHAAARALLRAAMTELSGSLDEGGARLLHARAAFRMACAHAAETANGIVEKLAALAGTAALLETGTLERRLRDVHAASRHIAMAPHSYITGGRIALGLEPGPGRL
ncbi:MAG: acyl-CoA dehydrogenase family protein [Alphaproteobacteria bacterium]